MPPDRSAHEKGRHERNDDGIVHLSSAQVRCLAHPLRVRLLGTLRLSGPSTSARLAQELDTNTGATSYHLRQLADVGLVIEDESRGTARERWWQAAHRYSTWVPTDFDDDPDDRAAAEWILGYSARLKSTWREQWATESSEWSDEWRNAADSSDLRMELTPAQLRSMNDEILDVVRRYQDTEGTESGDVQPVLILLDTFPAPHLRD